MSVEPFIKCRDVKLSLAFYSQVLDFRVKTAPDPDPTAFGSKHALLEREGCCVHLSSHEGDGVFGNVIYVRVTNLDELYSRFVGNGLNIDDRESPPALRGGPVAQSWGMTEFWVHDPDGNTITFGQRTTPV